jgi:autotransporter translocation and assembly factor TamB
MDSNLEETKGDRKKVNVKMLWLATKNQELEKKKEAWNDINHAYKKALKSINKGEGLEG